MDERARAILEEAFDTIERVERAQAERAPEREQREANELLYGNGRPRPNSKTGRASRIDDRGLIYKTTTQPEPKETPIMDAATQKRWEDWANAIIQSKLLAFADLMGEEVGQVEKRFNTELKRLEEKLMELKADMAELKLEVEILRKAKNVTPLRTQHVA